ncbi:hypothetical protein HO133_006099 [Letharia lupina]|uniref:Uncharacterized protein n=1 Tax=Letharia lupina TaxID=560253 RepID=A0A8H6C775_9LECA|nr:uncharacterized protein HO133_006099 [Letharia lupina]KAF6218140.1 hypothetical protein HO133_006099 [Letharia lupina]
MRAIVLSLAYLFYTARTTFAVAFPKQSSGLWTNAPEDDTLPATSGNTTLRLEPNPSALLNVSALTITCLTEPPPRQPITLAAYYEAVQKILIRDDAFFPRRFELGPGGKNLRWQGGQCVIAFFNNQPLKTDAIPIILVAHVAALIANECITEAKGYLGGVAQIGPSRGTVGVFHTVPSGSEADERYEALIRAVE